jgi:putative tryptophan/tyrosine transport system substrate-binding protein
MQFDQFRRRDFIALLGGAASAWPLAARAQQPDRMRRVGILMNLAADDPQGQTRVAAFLQGLQEAGWAVGRNLQIDIRWGDRDAERNRKNVAELVALSFRGAYRSSRRGIGPEPRAAGR